MLVDIKDDYPTVNNDESLCRELVSVVGGENIVRLDPLMISEDFSYYQKATKGMFFMLGSRNEEKGFVNGLHNLNFNFDEDVLLDGLEIYIKLLSAKGAIKL